MSGYGNSFENDYLCPAGMYGTSSNTFAVCSLAPVGEFIFLFRVFFSDYFQVMFFTRLEHWVVWIGPVPIPPALELHFVGIVSIFSHVSFY